MTDDATSVILERLQAIDDRLHALESAVAAATAAAQQREDELRSELARKSAEMAALGEQGLHVVELLAEAKRRIRELEAAN